MTTDECAAVVYGEQGFLVIGSARPLVIGCVVRDNNPPRWGEPVSAALTVVGSATRADFAHQLKRLDELSGHPDTRDIDWSHFYRVTVSD